MKPIVEFMSATQQCHTVCIIWYWKYKNISFNSLI